MHEEKIDTRAVTILAGPTGIALLVTGAGLPANTAQSVAFFLRELVPLVAAGVPELVEQAMFRRHQPRQQRRVQTGAFAGLGKTSLDGDEMIVQFRQRQRPIEAQHLPGERAAAGIAERRPDFVEFDFEFVDRRRLRRIGAHQPPVHFGAVARRQIADHLVTRRRF
ncbi:hypothetical protein D3C72_716010 [compost metagenome]